MPYRSADPNAFLGIGMQSALGSPQLTASKLRFVKYLTGNGFDVEPEIVAIREGGDGLDYGYTYKKSQKTAGQLVANLRPEIAGHLLSILLGGATWDGGSSPAIHTFHTGHASFPWSTIIGQHPGSAMVHRLSDIRFGGFDVEFGSGELIKVTAPYTAIQHGGSQAAVSPTYYLDEPFRYMGGTYVIDGTVDSDVVGWKLSVAYGLEELYSNDVVPDEIVVQNRDINLEITRRFESPTLWQKVAFGGGVTPTFSVPTGSFRGLVGYPGAPAPLLDFNARLLSYLSNNITELDPDGKTVTETITAKVLKGATHALTAVLNNTHASAYAP